MKGRTFLFFAFEFIAEFAPYVRFRIGSFDEIEPVPRGLFLFLDGEDIDDLTVLDP